MKLILNNEVIFETTQIIPREFFVSESKCGLVLLVVKKIRGKVVLAPAMKTYRGSGGMVPLV